MTRAKRELQLELPLAAGASGADGQFSLAFQEAVLPVRVRRSRRSTIAVGVDERGIHVSAPRGVTLPSIEQALHARGRSLGDRLSGRRAGARPGPARWHDGVAFPYLGRLLTLRLGGDEAVLRGDELHLPAPPAAGEAQIRDRAHAWLQQQARCVLQERMAACAARRNVAPGRWSLSFAGDKWASADPDGRLRLSWRLIHRSPCEIDAIVGKALSRRADCLAVADLWSDVAVSA